jgi:flagellar basal-body rod modification protein FlgD
MATNAASSASQAAQTTTSTTPPATSSSASSGTQQISESTFLQLLVAQLQNQDPMQPMDGMQFVTQLAQFSQLESTYGIQNDTDQLVADAGGSASTAASSTGAATGTTGS